MRHSRKWAGMRADGQRTLENPVLHQQFEMDRTICTGERQKAALSGVTVSAGGLAGAIAAQQRGDAADQVAQGCMAEKGYILVREDEVEAKRAELQAIAEQKKKQDLAAAAAAATQPPKRK